MKRLIELYSYGNNDLELKDIDNILENDGVIAILLILVMLWLAK